MRALFPTLMTAAALALLATGPPRRPTARPRVAAPPSSARSKTTSRRPRRTATAARKPACAARWPRRTAPIAACRTSAKPTCAKQNKVAEREGELKQARAKGKPEKIDKAQRKLDEARAEYDAALADLNR